MHRFFEKLKPHFFRAWDNRLLLNRPALWATKFHYALMFGLMGLALSSLAIWMLPVDLTAVPNAWNHLMYAAVPSAIGLAFWIWQVSLFKTDQAFGEAGAPTALRDQMIYVLVLLMAVGIPFLHGYRVSQKVANTISDNELVADINHLNKFESFTTDNSRWEFNSQGLSKGYSNYTFQAYTDYPIEIENINSTDYNFNEFRDLSKPYHEAELLEGLEKYLSLLSKYSGASFSVTAEEIFQEFNRNKEDTEKVRIYGSAFRTAKYETEENLEKLQEAKRGESHIFRHDARWGVEILFLWGLGLLLIGLQTNARSFLISALLGGGLLAGGLMLSETLGRFYQIGRIESWLSSMHILVMLILGLLIIGRKTTRKTILWRQVILSLFVAGLVFLPISVWQIGYELKLGTWINRPYPAFHRPGVFETLIFSGACLPLILWNLGLRQSFIRLHVRPKTQ